MNYFKINTAELCAESALTMLDLKRLRMKLRRVKSFPWVMEKTRSKGKSTYIVAAAPGEVYQVKGQSTLLAIMAGKR